MTTADTIRIWTSFLADPEPAAPPSLPARSPQPVRRHSPSYQRMMANTYEAQSQRAGDTGFLEVRQAMDSDDSPVRRHPSSDRASKRTIANCSDSWRMHRVELDSGRGLGAQGAYLQRDVYQRRDVDYLADTDAAATRTVVAGNDDTLATESSAGTLPASSPPPHNSCVGAWKVLTEEDVATIFQARLERSGGRSHVASKLAERFGVASRTVRDIWNLRTWVKTTRPLWSNAEIVREATTRAQSSHHSVDDFGGWKICSSWLVPGEELMRDEFDVVLEKILASDPKFPVALPHQKSTVQRKGRGRSSTA